MFSFPFRFFTKTVTGKKMEVNDLLNSNKFALNLLLALAIDSLVVSAPLGLVTGLVSAYMSKTYISGFIGGNIIILMFTAIHILWRLAKIEENDPKISSVIHGGTIYVMLEAGGNIGLTPKIGVVKNPDVPSAIEVNLPGIWPTLDDAKWQTYKPYFRQKDKVVPYDAEAIADLLRNLAKHY